MTETFSTRIQTLNNLELLDYIENYSKYKFEAIETAVIELRKRGYSITNEELRAIRVNIYHQNIEKKSRDFPPSRVLKRLGITHLRSLAIVIIISGFISSIIIYLTAEPIPLNPLGYDPLDTKKYIRDLEFYGGKANVLAAEFRQWFDGLWHGKSLAFTVGFISVIVALLLWFIGTSQHVNKNDDAKLESDPI